MARSADDTRTELIDAAKELYHRQGFYRTTLAEVAARASVPVGSVYYYFRSKEALAQAVIQAHAEDICSRFAGWDTLPHPRARLKALLASSAHYAGIFARYGCPYGTLAVELDKENDALVEPVGKLLMLYVDWVAVQYTQMGAGDQAEALAMYFVAAMQGAYLLANAFRDPDLLTRELDRLAAGVDAWSDVQARQYRLAD
jgi:TetR/AcrR family transcriptional regulator, transcriptional repressor for nem operon